VAQPDFFTPTSIISTGVATLAVNVATNTLYKLLKLPATWTAFCAALIIAYVNVAMQDIPHWYDWVLGFFNACLLFCCALGVNEVGVARMNRPGAGFATVKPLIKTWLKH
jgi:prepilin signal peptidase PulO-like enzyme (type II secretory pathway)